MRLKNAASETALNKTIRWVSITGLHVFPVFSFFAVITFSGEIAGACLVSATVWILFFCILRVKENDKDRLGLWVITSLLVALLLVNPGALTFIAWSVNGFAP